MASEKKLNPHMLDADEASQTKQKQRFQQMMTRKMFVVPSFEIYGGVAGLYDYGPPGSALFQSIVNVWRQHFVFQEEMLEISGPAMTPEPVLKASGHVDRFSDFMVKDEKTGDCYRADKLIEAHMDTLLAALKPDQVALKHEYDKVRTEAGAMKGPALDEVIKKYKIVAPDTGNALGSAYTFNLMFKTSIGPTGKITGFLRPETAQGIFVNFKRLLEYNGGKLPFAAAQIGPAFRNEIAPRSGLIRVREFTLAEIEHFVDPEDKSHPKFSEVADLQLQLLSQAGQEDGANKVEKVALRDAVKKGTINSETLAYFLGRTYLFLTRIGIKSDKLRFRQHQHDEMAHYAKDCWDAEIFTTYGWVECVGHADRADYDLTQHTLESKSVLEASKVHEKPIEVEKHTLNFNFKDMAAKFQKKAKDVQDELKRKSKAEIIAFEQLLNTKGAQEISICTGEKFTIEPGMFKIAFRKEKEQVKNFVPHVIEPSFGLGRIFYSLLEHSFDDSQYTEENQKLILRLPAVVAPLKALIAPVTTNENLVEFSKQVNREFVRRNLSTKTDFSGVSIGKKYARADELGVPFCVSIDPDSLTDKCVVIRDRESTNQIRVKIEDGVFIVDELVRGNLTWDQAYEKYPKFSRPEN